MPFVICTAFGAVENSSRWAIKRIADKIVCDPFYYTIHAANSAGFGECCGLPV